MNGKPISRLAATAEAAALSGGAQLQRFFQSSFEVRTKEDRSLVTDADLASEKAILDIIKDQFPEDLICSEEAGLSSTERQGGKSIWIIDPLDGTHNFAYGYEFFCVSVARGRFIEDGSIEIEVGAVLDPIRDRLWIAEKGCGTWCNDKQVSVSSPKDLEHSFLVTGFYYNRDSVLDNDLKLFRKIAGTCPNIRRDGAAALDLALVAHGVFHCFWERNLKPWDMAAGSLLVEEAGGIIKGYKDNKWDCESNTIVAGHSRSVSDIRSYISD